MKSLYKVLTLLVLISFVSFAQDARTTTKSYGNPTTIEQDLLVKYLDQFNSGNSNAQLEARGYKTYNQSSPVGTTNWFTGNPTVFASYEGPDSGYVGANYNNTSGAGTIDNWLVLPKLNVSINDTIKFYQTSPNASTYPDSLWVMYSAVGDSTPTATSWVLIGKSKTSTAGWAPLSFVAPTAGLNARFAIRYHVTNGGPSGANSDYVGIDYLTVSGVQVPVELASFTQSVVNGAVVLNWATATELNNSHFEIARLSNATNEFVTIGSVKGNGTTTEKQYYSFTDNSVESGVYTYRLTQYDLNGTNKVVGQVEVVVSTLPTEFALGQNYPNPFNPSTTISYSLPIASNVVLKVYDMLGSEIATLVNENKEAGNYTVNFNAKNFGSGVYFYTINAGSFNTTKKMIINK